MRLQNSIQHTQFFMEGKTINGFELKRLLGVGGMAEVWYAENEIHKAAAVKILNEDLSHNANIVERFRNEAEIMVRLDHPNIRQVFGYGTIDGRPSIVMEYLEGDDMKALMKQGRRFNNDELVRWWNQMVDALNYTHSEDIIHRDIKPSNIFIDKRGNVKLLDFGIAKVRESITMTQTGAMLGTLMYMSPEQVQDSKHLDYRSDVYSLAVSFVHLLTGKRPYDSDTMSDYAIRKGIVEQELDLSAVPAAWRTFLKPYLAKDPADRPTLRPFAADSPSSGSGSGGFAIRPQGNGVLQTPSEDEGTVVANQPQLKERQQPVASVSTAPASSNGKPKSKKVLWIALAAAAVAALVAVLVMNNKGGDTLVPTRPTVVEQSANDGDLNINANGVNFTMKFVQGGTFQMGSNDSEAHSDEQPVHSVTLSSYYMGETEVTQALWKAVMGSEPTYNGGWEYQYGRGDNYPAYRVSWDDCQEFIRKLNQLTGRNFRLPTEAEWEYAARGGNKSNGYKYAGSNTIDDVAWCTQTTNDSGARQVKMKSPNELGLYDMSGNVWEWCSDLYGDYGSGSQTNPQGPSNGSRRVLRGGSWGDGARDCRVSYRYFIVPDIRDNGDGFRLALPQ